MFIQEHNYLFQIINIVFIVNYLQYLYYVICNFNLQNNFHFYHNFLKQ